MTHPFLDRPRPLAFAHRGGDVGGPENTLAAFAAAWERGYRTLETDVHASADGVAVIHHDSTLARVTGTDVSIGELSAAELSAITVDGHVAVPTLASLFEAFPDAYFNLDPKSDNAVAPLITELERHDRLSTVCVGSFSDERIEVLRNHFGDKLCSSPGPRVARQVVVNAVTGRRVPGERCVQLPFRYHGVLLPGWLIARIQAVGVQVHVWTVNNVAEMTLMLDRGVDGIMTDRTETLAALLEQRGVFHVG